MNCTNCGAYLAPGDQQCRSCGAWVGGYNQPYVNNIYVTDNNLPPQYRPMGAWEYFGYMLLYSIPVIGFICLIVFSFSDSNINRRNFTRSYWCALLIVAVVLVILLLTGVLAGSSYSRYYY